MERLEVLLVIWIVGSVLGWLPLAKALKSRRKLGDYTIALVLSTGLSAWVVLMAALLLKFQNGEIK